MLTFVQHGSAAVPKAKRSGLPGVTWDRRHGKWMVQIRLGHLRMGQGFRCRRLVAALHRSWMVETGALILGQRLPPPLDLVPMVDAPEEMGTGRLVEIARVEPFAERLVLPRADRPVGSGAPHGLQATNLQSLGNIHPVEPMLAALDALGRLSGVLLLALFALGRLFDVHFVRPYIGSFERNTPL